MSKKLSAKQKEENEEIQDPKFMKAVDRVFAKLQTRVAVFDEDRADCFTGVKLFNFLKTHKHKNIPKFQNDEEIIEFANRMCLTGLVGRCELSQITQKLMKKGEETRLILVPHKTFNTFDVNDKYSVYIWIYKGSQTSIKFMSFGLIIGTIGICLIKVWPLWLKIVVYWLSLTMLVTLSSLIIIRLVLFCIMWTFGFRGLWLFPNLLNDEISFFETFKPVFGKGINDEQQQQQGGGGKDQQQPTWDFGIINIIIIFLIGIGFCWWIGLFDAQSIPEFVVQQNDLFQRYPALAPPDYNPNDNNKNENNENNNEKVTPTQTPQSKSKNKNKKNN